MLRVRMLPFQSIVPALERSMRDLCRRLGKQATLTVEGEDVCLDRAVLEQLTDTLTHLMRNALDHGIEDPETREASGKERTGRIHIGLERASDTVLLHVSDDGAGMDHAALRRRAVESGALDEAAAALLSEADALLLATLHGVTTAATATEISGRGVGLDVVRGRVEAMGGGIDLSTERGQGTRILLRLPPSVTVLTAFLVRTGEDLWAVPVRKVEETVSVETASGQASKVPWRGRMVKAYSLGDAMGSAGTGVSTGSTAIIHYRGGDPVAALVDGVEARRELLVKPLLGPLEAMGEVIGAAVTGDGEVTPVLDLDRVEPPPEFRILERSA
jgi:two-component system chemotaxis sensor kinase CheA